MNFCVAFEMIDSLIMQFNEANESEVDELDDYGGTFQIKNQES